MTRDTLTADRKVKPFGKTGFLVFLSFLNATIMLSSDIVLPALPTISKDLQVSESIGNLLISLFFIGFSASMLFWGPMSDKYGRKKILLIGSGSYVVFNLMCALSPNYSILIVSRVLQSIGSSSIIAVAMASVKDVYEEHERVRAYAIMQTLMLITPIVTPAIGAALLQVVSWRGLFFFLIGIGAISFSGCLIVHETNDDLSNTSVFTSLSRLLVVLKNPSFSAFLVLHGFAGLPILTFLGASSIIYISIFGLNEQMYSLYFAINAAFALLGPYLSVYLGQRMGNMWVITLCFGLMLVSGLLIVFTGSVHPVLMCIAVIPASVAATMSRAPGSSLLMEQQEKDTGAASSLMSFALSTTGSLGMMLVTAGWSNIFLSLGLVYSIAAVICLVAWPYIRSRIRIPQGF